MVRHRWTYVTEARNSKIYVDYRTKTTKIEGRFNVYYYEGIYPNIDYNTRRKFRK